MLSYGQRRNTLLSLAIISHQFCDFKTLSYGKWEVQSFVLLLKEKKIPFFPSTIGIRTQEGPQGSHESSSVVWAAICVTWANCHRTSWSTEASTISLASSERRQLVVDYKKSQSIDTPLQALRSQRTWPTTQTWGYDEATARVEPSAFIDIASGESCLPSI